MAHGRGRLVRLPDTASQPVDLAVALAAIQAGAALSNYADAVGPLAECGGWWSAGQGPRHRRRTVDVQAAVTLLAAGSGLGALTTALRRERRAPAGPRDERRRRPAGARRCRGGRGPSGRMLTLVPWRGYTLVGTFQSTNVIDGTESSRRPTRYQMLEDLNAAFPPCPHGATTSASFITASCRPP